MATKAAPTKKAPVKKSAPKKAVATKAEKPVVEKYTLKQLHEDVAGRMPMVSRATVAKVVDTTFDAVKEAFIGGKAVNIKDFGKIEIKHRPERIGRNPKTGESITIPAKVVPKFSFAKNLKEAAAQ